MTSILQLNPAQFLGLVEHAQASDSGCFLCGVPTPQGGLHGAGRVQGVCFAALDPWKPVRARPRGGVWPRKAPQMISFGVCSRACLECCKVRLG